MFMLDCKIVDMDTACNPQGGKFMGNHIVNVQSKAMEWRPSTLEVPNTVFRANTNLGDMITVDFVVLILILRSAKEK